ncbi:MAG: AAA family ATPase [Candidatus Baldrarchaeia archaeon]
MSSRLLQYASQIAKEATKLDRQGNYRKAIEKYVKAAELLLKLSKLTENPKLQSIYFQRAKEYIERSKELKNYIGGKTRRITYITKSGKKITEEVDPLTAAIADTVVYEKPKVRWEDVADLQTAKSALREAIIIPMLRPDLFSGPRKPWKGILLYGPPGCGKTLLAKAAAAECDATFFNVDAASLVSKWLGESEKLVKALFNLARQKQPSIIFIDEVDSIATARAEDDIGGERRLKTQLLIEMDGLKDEGEERIIVLGATNRPWEIDPAMRRRFEKRIYVPLPDREARKEIFRIHTEGVELAPDVDFDKLAELTDGYSGADIALICREALMIPIRELDQEGKLTEIEKLRPVTMQDFMQSLSKIKPSVSQDEITRYEEWTREFGT